MSKYRDQFRWSRRTDGQALVEFALASVLYFTLLFGIIQFGLATWQYNAMSDLAQVGARWASVRGSTSTTPANAAQLQTFVQGRSPGFTVTATASPANPSAALPGTSISVQVVSTFAPVTLLLPFTTLNLSSTATMVVSR